MATHELTKEQLLRIYSSYWGAPCAVKVYDEWKDGQIGVDWYVLRQLFLRDRPLFKIILMPLYLISDEDAIEVARLATNSRNPDNIKISNRTLTGVTVQVSGLMVNISGRRVSVGVYASDDDEKYFWNSNQTQITDFLRSRGYDCGFMDIPSLIEAGYALDKTKIDKQ